jgi:hypothetical protein
MRMVPIIKRTPYGKRAFPIGLDEVEQMVLDGKAIVINRGLYAEADVPPATVSAAPKDNEDDDEIPVAPIYQTKVMEAETPKRRGRPRKVAQ